MSRFLSPCRSPLGGLAALACLWLAGGTFPPGTMAQAAEPPLLPAEAKKAWDRYRAQSITYSTARTIEHDGTRKESLFKAYKDHRISMVERFHRDGKYEGEVWGRNSKYVFRLVRKQNHGPWILTNIAWRGRGDEHRYVDRMLETHDLFQLSYPNTIYHVPITRLITLKSFRLTDMTTEIEGERRLVWMSFEVDPSERVIESLEALFRRARVCFEPARSWVLVRGEIDFEPRKTKFEYEDFREIDGLWYPFHKWSVAMDKNGRPLEGTMQLEELRTTPAPPLNEFTLSAFGLPEPDDGTRPWGLYLWLALIGVALVAVGLYLRSR
jgi:hypothetical protein